MPPPTRAQNIHTKNLVRRGLSPERTFTFIDDDAIAKMSGRDISYAISRGILTVERAAEIIPAVLPGQVMPAVTIAKPKRAGDFVTGLSTTYLIRSQGLTNVGVATFRSQKVSGPCVVVDALLNIGWTSASPVTDNRVIVDIRYTLSPPVDNSFLTYAQWVMYPSLLRTAPQDDIFGSTMPGVYMFLRETPDSRMMHIDTYIPEGDFYFLLGVRSQSVGSSSAYATAAITTRSVESVDRAATLPTVRKPITIVTQPPAINVITPFTRSLQNPTVLVPTSPTQLWRVFLPLFEFRVNAKQLKEVYKWYNVLLVVPENEADFRRSEAHPGGLPAYYKGLQPLPEVLGELTDLPVLFGASKPTILI